MPKRTIEGDVLQKKSADLIAAIERRSDLAVFGEEVSSARFVPDQTVRGIISTGGITKFEKVSKIMSAVKSYIINQAAQDKVTEKFDAFVLLLRDKLELDDVAKDLADALSAKKPGYTSPLIEGAVENPVGIVPPSVAPLQSIHQQEMDVQMSPETAVPYSATSPSSATIPGLAVSPGRGRVQTDASGIQPIPEASPLIEGAASNSGNIFTSDYKVAGLQCLASGVSNWSTRSLLRLKKVYSEGVTGSGVRLAIIEHDFNPSHKAFEGMEIPRIQGTGSGTNFDHATSVVGIAVGKQFTSTQPWLAFFPGGVAPGASVTVFGGVAPFDSLIQPLKEILESETKYDVVSISSGIYVDNLSSEQRRNFKPYEDEVCQLIDRLVGQGVSVFAASGNEGNQQSVCFPAILPNVISVGSMTKNAQCAEDTSDSDVDVYCFGDGVLAPKGNDLDLVSGSSMATPAVAALACLAIQCAKKHCYMDLHRKHKMKKMLNVKMRQGGSKYVFGRRPEEFLLKAWKDRDTFSDL